MSISINQWFYRQSHSWSGMKYNFSTAIHRPMHFESCQPIYTYWRWSDVAYFLASQRVGNTRSSVIPSHSKPPDESSTIFPICSLSLSLFISLSSSWKVDWKSDKVFLFDSSSCFLLFYPAVVFDLDSFSFWNIIDVVAVAGLWRYLFISLYIYCIFWEKRKGNDKIGKKKKNKEAKSYHVIGNDTPCKMAASDLKPTSFFDYDHITFVTKDWFLESSKSRRRFGLYVVYDRYTVDALV